MSPQAIEIIETWLPKRIILTVNEYSYRKLVQLTNMSIVTENESS